MKKIFSTALLALLVVILSGCGDYLVSRGQALNNVAQARRIQAEADRSLAQAEHARAAGEADAQRKQAEAQLETAQANKAVSEASADVLRTNANMPIIVIGFAGLAILLISGLAAFVIWFRTPAAPAPQPIVAPPPPPTIHIVQVPSKPGLRIETPAGVVLLEPEPGETRPAFLLRCRETAHLLGAGDWQGGGRMLTDGQ